MTDLMSAALGIDSSATKERWTHSNGVVIVMTDNNCFGIAAPEQRTPRVLSVEVDYRGKMMKQDFFNALNPYRDSLDVDLRECMIRVKEGAVVLAELGTQPQGAQYQPWMVWQGDQQHVTENYVSIPPALRIVDQVGALWTLGFVTAHASQSPQGEFAFNVIRDGFDVGEIASRIECRNGQVRIFTRHGWKRWLGREWSS